jgi:hypothetical protein
MQKFRKEISLAFVNPELAKEWDFERNQPLTPESVFAKSGKKVWWKCKNNHTYDARIQARNGGNNCPYCSGHRVCSDNCLDTIYPELAKEWNYKKNGKLTPKDVSCGSRKKVWWTCNVGHTWIASIKTRSYGHGCPYCSNKMASNETCLATKNPKLTKEWHPIKNGELTPYDVLTHSGKKIWWICNMGHEWETTIANRSKGHNCPYCSGRKVNGDNCLGVVDSKMAKKWDYKRNGRLTPKKLTVSSGKKVWWKCRKCGHSYIKSVAEQKAYPICHNCNSLMLKNPELSKEWNISKNGKLTPIDVASNSKKKVWWKCKQCGYEYNATICNRNRGSGCPVCKYKKIVLKNGVVLDSVAEAYYYLKLEDDNIKFNHHVNIGLGRHSCDFYVPTFNKYIEVTSYTKQWKHWDAYYKNILKKKKHIINKLKAGFKFIQLKLNYKQIRYVRKNMA